MSKNRSTWMMLLGVAAFSLAGMPLQAQAAGEHKHDGFYLRLGLGLGYNSMEADSSPKTTLTGPGGAFNLSIGGMVVENLGIFGELSDSVASNPELKVGDAKFQTKEDVSAGTVGAGVGLIYYFMPVNLYVSGALVADKLTIQNGSDKIAETDTGVGANLMVGKEWWVSPNWGLGVAGALRLSKMDDKGGDPHWTATSFNVCFSATYN